MKTIDVLRKLPVETVVKILTTPDSYCKICEQYDNVAKDCRSIEDHQCANCEHHLINSLNSNVDPELYENFINRVIENGEEK